MKRSRSSQAAANSAKKLVFVGGEPDVPYDLETLLHASAEVVGRGWLGTTSRATLEGGAAVVAVKRLRDAPIPESEFRDKVATLAALRHENLAPLRAYFYSRGEKLLRVTGYSAPELTDSRRASREADVYSFGVLLLELLTGRIPANAVPGLDGVDLPQWVRSVVQEEWTAEVFDASVADEAHAEEEMMRLLKLAIECTEQRPERRPVMAEGAARIEHIVDGAVRNADVDDSESVSS
uniref:Protein kinase domain-containing protein n=1 Tax=Oryza brachyantha TaxID=4533 RepID=J3MX94_ORYBR